MERGKRLGRGDGVSLARGTVIVACLDPTVGHEQAGRRPCIVVSAPEVSNDQRFPLIAIVPLTSAPGVGLLYPRIQPSPSNGLRNASTALVDHIRSVDKRRVDRAYGQVSRAELQAIDTALKLFLGMPA
jgi:mRNA interferase MazF